MVEAFLGIQIIAAIFSVFMLYLAFIHFKRKNLGTWEFVFWVFSWCAVFYFAMFPRVLDPLIARLFITRVLDLVMIAGFIILSYLGFQNHIGIKSLQKQIQIIVSSSAIKNANKKKKKK